MQILFRGKLLKAFVEINPTSQICEGISLFLEEINWIELTGISLNNGFVLPSPLGCECIITDISDRQLENARYEIEFDSSYSRDGVFWANHIQRVNKVEL